MDIEQLRLILEVVRGAGVGAWWIALLWILQTYFKTAVWAGVVTTLLLGALRTIRKCSFTEQVKAAAGVRTELTSWDKEQILACLQEHQPAKIKL